MSRRTLSIGIIVLVLASAGFAKEPTADETQYMKALAHFHAGRHAETITEARAIGKQHPDSPWLRKALFLEAAALIELRRFEEAEKIYDAEANRLLSEARKEEIARVILEFADALCAEPDPNDPGAPPPNPAKAHNLYRKVLDLEIGRALEDEVRFRSAEAIRKAGNPHVALKELQAYLADFDPDWLGPVGSVERVSGLKKENPPPAGVHVLQARYRLCEAQFAARRPIEARQNAEDLLALIPDGKEPGLVADVRWMIVRTHGLPHPRGRVADAGVTAARRFLEHHPDEPRSVIAAWTIAEAHSSAGRSDQAADAFRAFGESDGFRLPAGEARDKPLLGYAKSPAVLFDEWRKQAVHNVGTIRFAQREYEKAIETWRRYVREFPDGPQWSLAQRGIIDSKFKMGLDAVADGKNDRAREVFADFLRSYPLDSRARQILFLLGQMHYATALEIEKWRTDESSRPIIEKAIEAWTRLVGKYPNTEESSLALYRVALIQEEKLGELEKALASYRRLTWGSWARKARARVTLMTTKQLRLETERKFRTNETATVKVSLRNIEKLTVKRYTLSLEAYFRKTHGAGGVEALDVGLIQPDKTWTFEVDGYSKYLPLEKEIEIPFGDAEPGVCLIGVTGGDLEATTLVIRSDLDVIVKSSRSEALVFAQNMRLGAPAAGVKLLLSDGKSVFATGKTGEDGVFLGRHEELKDLKSLRVFAVEGGHVAAHAVNLSGLVQATGLSARGYVYTDRPAYQPGQTVGIRGIIRDVADGSYVAPAGDVYVIGIQDAKGRLLREIETTLSEFGTFETSVPLDPNAPLGAYTIAVRHAKEKGVVYGGRFLVQRFRLEKMRLKLEVPHPVYFRGETVEVTATAEYAWGEPVIGRMLRIGLPGGRIIVRKTNENGEVKTSFDTTDMTPGTVMSLGARIEGENVTAQRRVTLAKLGYGLSVKVAEDVVLAGAPFDVVVSAKSPDGKPISRAVTLLVMRRKAVPQNPVLAGTPWVRMPTRHAAETTVSEHEVTTDAETGRGTVRLSLEAGGRYVLRVTGEDRFRQVVTAEGAVTISGKDDDTRLRFFAKTDTLKVGEDAAIRLHSRLEESLALVTYDGETILMYRVMKLARGMNDLTLAVGHEHFPNFRVAVAVMDGRHLRTAVKPFDVERRLHVTIRPVKDVFAPGAPGMVEITAVDHLGQPVRAELSLALVDDALFGLYPDRTPPIIDFFQKGARRQAEFRVAATNAFAYAGKTKAVNAAIKAEQQRLVAATRDAAAIQGLRRELEVAAKQVARPSSGGVRYRGPGGGGRGDGGGGAPSPEPQTDASKNGKDDRFADRLAKKGMSAPQPREEIPEAGWWLPSIITGADGKATIELDLPETTTRWRLTARGATVETLVGEARGVVITRKDFFVDIKCPASLMEGDSVQVLARLHNMTDTAGPADLTLTVYGGTDLDRKLIEKTARVDAVKHGETELLFDAFRTPAEMAVRIVVAAKSATHSDALARTVPVRPWGLEYADQGGGVAAGNAVVTLDLPSGREYTSRWLTVNLGPSLERTIVEMALGGGRAQARGCPPRWDSHPGSDLLAATAALKYARAVGAPEEDVRRLTERVRALVSTLVVTQNSAGNWTWRNAYSPSRRPGINATTFWALAEARKLGISVNAKTIQSAHAYLTKAYRELSANDNDGKAVILHALAEAGMADFAHANRLYRERNALSTGALARTALAFLRLDRKALAGEILDVLAAKAKTTTADSKSLCYWPGSPHRNIYWGLADEVETTALTLLALMEAKPGSARIRPAVDFLMHRRGAFGFQPARARGPAVAALAAYFSTGKYATTDMRIRVLVNGAEVRRVAADGERPVVSFPVPADVIGTGKVVVEFRAEGRGRYAYAATLRGFSPELKDPKSWSYPYVRSRTYSHAQLRYRDKPIGVNSTSPVKDIEIGQSVRVYVDIYTRSNIHGYVAIEEHLPAGMVYVKGSLKGHRGTVLEEDGRLVIFCPPNLSISDYSYELVGYATGEYRVLPTVIRDTLKPGRMRLGKATKIRVLAPGETSDDPYKMNTDEHFTLGRLLFDDGIYPKALEHLTVLFDKRHRAYERDVARMILWIHTSEGFYDAKQIVAAFEILRERHPDLRIPFDKILVVGRAYRDMGEFERAYHVFRATIDASFSRDAGVSAVLEDEGQFLGSIDYQEDLWREYPDTAQVTSAYLAISQSLYVMAPKAAELAKQERRRASDEGTERKRVPNRIEMLKETIRLLESFLALYPTDPLADDAAFSMASAWLDLKQYAQVIRVCESFEKKFPESDYASGYRFMKALGHFWRRENEKALVAAKVVGDGKSKDRDFARYIVGQIYHAQGKPAEAIDWYRKVAGKYSDAKDAIDYFEAKRIGLEEVTIVRPGEKVALDLEYRNIREAALQVYRVDLMKLYLREKNLSTITKVHLAGIKPEMERTIQLGDGRDYVDKEREIALGLTEEAAYLVICRGDDLFTSALVLITPLKIEVQADPKSGRLRANVLDTLTGGYASEVHVKAIGSADKEFRSGDTDLRGVFVAENLRGKATVIARTKDSRYAFYRGKDWLGAPPAAKPGQQQGPGQRGQQLDLQQNLRIMNRKLQKGQQKEYDSFRRGGKKGVEVQQAR
jgi:alpha-2-macroglobulin